MNNEFEVASRGAEDRGAESIGGAVGNGDGICDRFGAHKEEDGGEEFGLGNRHGGCDVGDEGRGEVVALGIVGVGVAFSTCQEAGAVADGVLDEVFELGVTCIGYGCTDIDGSVWRAVEYGSWAERADLRCEVLDEAVVNFG